MTVITLPSLTVRLTPLPQPLPLVSLSEHALKDHGYHKPPHSSSQTVLTMKYSGTSSAADHLPRYFAKSGHVDANPHKVKKNGAGKGGW
jgi:hypothetical protein